MYRCGSILLVALLLISSTLGATSLRPIDLETLTRLADQIFEGEVTEVHAGQDENGLPVVWVTVKVTHGIKNTRAGSLVNFKQFNGTVAGLPRYQPGEQVVLFLAAPSRQGLSAPVGLGIGKFAHRPGGREPEFVNAFENRGLWDADLRARLGPRLKTVEQQALGRAPGPLPRSLFISLVEKVMELDREGR